MLVLLQAPNSGRTDLTQDILPTYMGIQNLFGFLMGNNRPSNVDTVIAVKHTVLAVCWLAINQSVRSVEILADNN
jgi:hypothetical protein